MKIRDYKWIIITLLMVISIMVMIFMFSSQTASSSDKISGGITRKVIEFMERFAVQIPYFGTDEWVDTGYSLFEDINHYVRKFAHLTEFAILGMALCLHINSIFGYLGRKLTFKRVCIAEIVAILYACSDEFHQIFVDGRGPKLKDVCIDSIGAFLGCMFIFLIIIRRVRKKENVKECKS